MIAESSTKKRKRKPTLSDERKKGAILPRNDKMSKSQKSEGSGNQECPTQ